MKAIKIIKYIYLSVVSLIITFLGIYLVASLFSKTSYTQVAGYSFFEVQSYSMYPELDKGDLVVVKELDDDEYRVGMTITYLLPGDDIPTTHKIVKIEDNVITTRGINADTNDSNDDSFDVTYTIGKVVGVWENYHHVRKFITNPVGIVIVVLVGILLIETFNYLENKQKNNN